jgi:DNA-binding response OmpR family regulator
MSTARILVVEDDASIRLGLEDTLKAKGYRVICASHGDEALRLAREQKPDLVVLDIMLPDGDGFDVCRRLKDPKNGVPTAGVIMLTARGQELDRIRGFDVGADDYVTKPFSLMELLARVAAVLRRFGHGPGSDPSELAFGDVTIDFVKQTATKAGRPIELPPRAFDILRVFARRPGEVVTRETLLDEAWGYDKAPNTRTVDNHMVKLRQALEDEPERPRHLQTVHGTGYKLVMTKA